MNNFQSKLEKENEDTKTLVEENVKEEFDHSVQCYENEGDIEVMSPISRVHKDEIIYLESFIFEPTQESLLSPRWT